MRSMKENNFKYFIPAIIWAGIIFVVSSIPDLSTPSIGVNFSDKLAHFGVYSILGILTAYGFDKYGYRGKKIILYGILLTGFYGIFDEFHQYFVPGRFLEFFDIVADILGAFVGIVVYVKIFNRNNANMK